MTERSKSFFEKYRESILYILYGAITGVVSLGGCYATLKIGVLFINDGNGQPPELLDVLASTVQWVSSVLVAFFTNRKYVFCATEGGKKRLLAQFFTFSGTRVVTYFIEAGVNLLAIAAIEGMGYRAFEFLGLSFVSRFWAKLFSTVVVVIINYLLSKFVIFRKK